MCSFCFLAALDLIPIPKYSLLYLHSNNMNSLKSFSWRKLLVVKKPQIKSVVIG